MPGDRAGGRVAALNWEISERKVRQYLLNIDHREGRSKAQFFLAYGFSETDWQFLACALRCHPADNPVAAEEETEYGRKLIVRCQLRTPDGRNPCIRTVWMIKSGGQPRLVTAYPSAF